MLSSLFPPNLIFVLYSLTNKNKFKKHRLTCSSIMRKEELWLVLNINALYYGTSIFIKNVVSSALSVSFA